VHEDWEPAPSEATTFDGMIAAARQLVQDQNIDFAFVHLYLPHPPGFYDRRNGRVAAGGSYIDNLALADRSLGNLLQTLAATPGADKTTLILSSDHSWRVSLWRDTFGWTKEDELASGHGHFDPRPMLMVRFPGETNAVGISRPVPLLAMHNLIEQMMAGRIENPQQLAAWAGRQ
jgi:arylsulfatase A-like enzyme